MTDAPGTRSLELDLAISDRPFPPSGHGRALRQDWVGGATDRETRGMIPEPRRWLRLVEFAAGKTVASETAAGALHAWRLQQIVPGNAPSPEGAGGLILVSMDVDPAVEEEFNDWYTTEHIPLLSAVPGMIRARRFRARQGSPAYVALYHVEDIAIYASAPWTSANETPWIKRMRNFQKNRTYLMFRPVSGESR